jgi:acetoacetyl-CoA synthetase
VTLDDDLRRTLASALRSALSPRHVPDRIDAMPAIRQELEVVVKRLLLGARVEDVVDPATLPDPSVLDSYVGVVVDGPLLAEWRPPP